MISEETLQIIAVHTVSSATRKNSKAAQQQKDLQTQDKCKTTSLSVTHHGHHKQAFPCKHHEGSDRANIQHHSDHSVRNLPDQDLIIIAISSAHDSIDDDEIALDGAQKRAPTDLKCHQRHYDLGRNLPDDWSSSLPSATRVIHSKTHKRRKRIANKYNRPNRSNSSYQLKRNINRQVSDAEVQ